MSYFSECNFNGKVASDMAVTNANLGQSLRVSRADICDEIVENSVINNLSVNNFTVNTINIIDNSYQTGQLTAPFTHDMAASGMAGYNPGIPLLPAPQVPNATKVPLTASLGAGTSLSFAGNDVIVQQTGVYTISYNVIYQTFNAGVLNPLGAPGVLNNPPPTVNGTVQCFIAINDNLTPSALNAFSSFNAQLIQLPFTAGSVTLVLNAGDIISLYSYAMRNVVGTVSNVTIGDANMTVVAST